MNSNINGSYSYSARGPEPSQIRPTSPEEAASIPVRRDQIPPSQGPHVSPSIHPAIIAIRAELAASTPSPLLEQKIEMLRSFLARPPDEAAASEFLKECLPKISANQLSPQEKRLLVKILCTAIEHVKRENRSIYPTVLNSFSFKLIALTWLMETALSEDRALELIADMEDRPLLKVLECAMDFDGVIGAQSPLERRNFYRLLDMGLSRPSLRQSVEQQLIEKSIYAALRFQDREKLERFFVLLKATHPHVLQVLVPNEEGGKKTIRERLIEMAVTYRSLQMVDLLLAWSERPDEDLKAVILWSAQGNLDDFTLRLLERPPQAPLEFIQRLAKVAEDWGNLSLLAALKRDWQQGIKESLTRAPNLRERLLTYFLNSHTRFFSQLLEALLVDGRFSKHREMLKALQQFSFTGGCLIARFPEPRNQQEIVTHYGTKGISYESQQFDYAQRRYRIVLPLIDEIKRGAPKPSLKDIYRRLSDCQWRDEDARTALVERYESFGRFAIPTLLTQGKEISCAGTRLTQLFPDFSYRGIVMHHTDPKGPQEAWLDQLGLSKDFEQLLSQAVDRHDAKSLEAFQKGVATFYWKGCQLMPTTRGNSQTMLELHYLLYAVHGLQPPAIAKEVALPDCVALTTTLDAFVTTHYRTCFEF